MFIGQKKKQQRFREEGVRLATIADKYGVFGDTSNPEDKKYAIDSFASLIEGQAYKNASEELELTFPILNVRIIITSLSKNSKEPNFFIRAFPHPEWNTNINYVDLGSEMTSRSVKKSVIL